MRRLPVLVGAVLSLAAAPRDTAGQVDAGLKALRSAPDVEAARAIEARLHDVWRRAATPGCTMLLERAAREVQAGDGAAAVEDADAVLVLDPEFVEAFAVRAAARLAAADARGAVRDAAEALRREPRHIGALEILSHAAEQAGDMAAAYQAWQDLLALDPNTAQAKERLRELHRRAEGEAI